AARPNGYFWYQKSDGHYTCSAKQPEANTPYTQCNRVIEIPLFDYLTDFQYGAYWYMHNPSIIGLHVERIAA
ncbi:MAG: DUF1460 domain-containing protein, partial [Pseudomonadota bacterium]|nr:DUF1460 domain-containing protein [Pseudomonadota bacterium]